LRVLILPSMDAARPPLYETARAVTKLRLALVCGQRVAQYHTRSGALTRSQDIPYPDASQHAVSDGCKRSAHCASVSPSKKTAIRPTHRLRSPLYTAQEPDTSIPIWTRMRTWITRHRRHYHERQPDVCAVAMTLLCVIRLRRSRRALSTSKVETSGSLPRSGRDH